MGALATGSIGFVTPLTNLSSHSASRSLHHKNSKHYDRAEVAGTVTIVMIMLRSLMISSSSCSCSCCCCCCCCCCHHDYHDDDYYFFCQAGPRDGASPVGQRGAERSQFQQSKLMHFLISIVLIRLILIQMLILIFASSRPSQSSNTCTPKQASCKDGASDTPRALERLSFSIVFAIRGDGMNGQVHPTEFHASQGPRFVPLQAQLVQSRLVSALK